MKEKFKKIHILYFIFWIIGFFCNFLIFLLVAYIIIHTLFGWVPRGLWNVQTSLIFGGGPLLAFEVISNIILIDIKNKKARKLVKSLEKYDKSWNIVSLKTRTEEIFYKIRAAYREGKPEILQTYLSETLTADYTREIRCLWSKRGDIIVTLSHVRSTTLLEVNDYLDDTKDQVLVKIEGTRAKYIIDLYTGEALRKRENEPGEEFLELWRLTRRSNEWILEEVVTTKGIGLINLLFYRSFSEELK